VTASRLAVVVGFPLSKLAVEQGGGVDDDVFELAAEFFAVDAVGAFYFAVEPRR
jgi:hypothetical protein